MYMKLQYKDNQKASVDSVAPSKTTLWSRPINTIIKNIFQPQKLFLLILILRQLYPKPDSILKSQTTQTKNFPLLAVRSITPLYEIFGRFRRNKAAISYKVANGMGLKYWQLVIRLPRIFKQLFFVLFFSKIASTILFESLYIICLTFKTPQ